MNQVKAHLQTYPCPLNINFLWNFGFLIAITFLVQIVTGVLLASNYTPDITLAFYSVQYIIREVGSGWYFRYLHSTGASFVFALTYLHILRALAGGSCFYLPVTWTSGLVLFFISIMTAFLGYVLPWGQMSFWGATVITNLLSPIPGLVSWICGGYYVSNPTLKRFFVLHFVFPFVCLCVVFIHIFFLHLQGSTNPLGYDTSLKVPFFPNILSLDFKGFNNICVVFFIQTFFGFLTLSHPDNSCEVDRFVTPLQIVPEWYFLPFYAMLKAIPNKNAGFIILIASIQCLFLFGEVRAFTTLILMKLTFGSREFSTWNSWFKYSFYSLLWIGAQLPQETFICYGRIFIINYFIFALVLLGLMDIVTSGVYKATIHASVTLSVYLDGYETIKLRMCGSLFNALSGITFLNHDS
uniref:Cytochrome b n=1 Tax=Klossia helicina TaxID=1072566 RepID=A0A8K1M5Z4_9APIC|nr:cytochrome b [Klossia helicina]UBN07448.1 cytochrome b [Klossia helicina]